MQLAHNTQFNQALIPRQADDGNPSWDWLSYWLGLSLFLLCTLELLV